MGLEGLLIKIAGMFIKEYVAEKVIIPIVGFSIESQVYGVNQEDSTASTDNETEKPLELSRRVISDRLAEAAIDRLVSVGEHEFEVRRRDSGVWIANSVIDSFYTDRLTIPNLPSKRNFRRIKQGSFPAFIFHEDAEWKWHVGYQYSAILEKCPACDYQGMSPLYKCGYCGQLYCDECRSNGFNTCPLDHDYSSQGHVRHWNHVDTVLFKDILRNRSEKYVKVLLDVPGKNGEPFRKV